MSLNNKIFFITGATRGLSKSVAETVLNDGGKVIMVDVVCKVGAQNAKEFQERFPKRVSFSVADVTDRDSVEKAWKEGEDLLGGKVNTLVNNAGIYPANDHKKCLNVNLVALMDLTYMAIERMSVASGGEGGAIVNITSVAGLKPATIPQFVPYSVSKAAVIHFTRCLGTPAMFEHHGVRVVSLCAMLSNTNMMNPDNAPQKLFLEKVTAPYGGIMPVERIVEEFMGLVYDKDNNGGVKLVLPDRPSEYLQFPNLMPPPL